MSDAESQPSNLPAPTPTPAATDFEKAAAESSPSVLGELFGYLRQHKKYWMIPTIVVLVLLGVLAWVGSSGGGFVYALF